MDMAERRRVEASENSEESRAISMNFEQELQRTRPDYIV